MGTFKVAQPRMSQEIRLCFLIFETSIFEDRFVLCSRIESVRRSGGRGV